MPPRHPTHRLEDRSRRQFESLLPDAWVVRSKHPDYGVDLEVEIFREDGAATGLIFYVQLRATADSRRARKTRIDVEQMAYFASLGAPTAIVRYSQPTEEFYWCWHFNRAQDERKLGSKTFTVAFSEADRWTQLTPSLIDQTLTLKRRVASVPAGGRVSFQRPVLDGDLHQRFAMDGAFHRLLRELSWLDEPDVGEVPLLTLTSVEGSSALELRAGPLVMVPMKALVSDTATQFGDIVYSLIGLFRQLDLPGHAADLARRALDGEVAHQDRDLAAAACLALIDEPMAMAKLAILNRLPTIQDPAYFLLTVALVGVARVGADRLHAEEAMFQCAIDFAKEQGDQYSEASVLYSHGNFCANCNNPRQAVRSFRAAMKRYPPYIERNYFRTELGDALYCSGRYRLAVKFYRSLTDQDSLSVRRRLANALFFSGRVGEACGQYQALKNMDQPFDGLMQAEVKSWVCEWLVQRHGDLVPNSRTQADKLLHVVPTGAEGAAVYETIIRQVDALSCLANFNVAVRRAGEKAYEDAWAGFMICALSLPNDVDAWVSALMCAMNIQETSVAVATMNVASHLGGAAVYEQFRAAMAKQGHPIEAIEALDEMARSLKAGKPKTNRGLTLRFNIPAGTVDR